MPVLKKQSPTKLEAIDYDSLTKEVVSHYFKKFIQMALPSLYQAVDWNYPPVFLEQEFTNLLKGKYKVKDKKRRPIN